MNKKGMSDVISTLLIVVITIVAVLLVWTAIRGNLQSSTVDMAKIKCASIDLSFNKCTTGATASYNAILAGGEPSKIVVIVSNATGGSDSNEHVDPGVGILSDTGMTVATAIQATAIGYVKASTGEEISCGVIAAQACTA